MAYATKTYKLEASVWTPLTITKPNVLIQNVTPSEFSDVEVFAGDTAPSDDDRGIVLEKNSRKNNLESSLFFEALETSRIWVRANTSFAQIVTLEN